MLQSISWQAMLKGEPKPGNSLGAILERRHPPRWRRLRRFELFSLLLTSFASIPPASEQIVERDRKNDRISLEYREHWLRRAACPAITDAGLGSRRHEQRAMKAMIIELAKRRMPINRDCFQLTVSAAFGGPIFPLTTSRT